MTAVKSPKAEHSSELPAELRDNSSFSKLRRADSVGYLYRSECSCGALYLGMSERLDLSAIERYAGSGQRWMDHSRAHADHEVAKIILGWCSDSLALRVAETSLILQQIAKYGARVLNLRKGGLQGASCAECGAFGRHATSCSSHVIAAVRTPPCSECSGKANHHRKGCSQYARKLAVCEECSTVAPGHVASCSRQKSCEECGSGNYRIHFSSCSQYVDSKVPCEHCGSKSTHRGNCPSNRRLACDDCGSQRQHKRGCSNHPESR